MASFPSLLADELDVSDDQARTLLTAMLREVHKQARQDQVHLPSLGTFRMEEGRLAFEPADELARAVNEEYEGLGPEDLPTAASGPASGSDVTEEKTDEGEAEPETASPGDDQDWSPFERTPTPTDDSDQEEAEEASADTEEFQVPSDAPDVSSSSTAQTSEAGDSSESSSDTDTEELYPLVEDDDEEVPSSSQSTEEADEEHASLSGIWSEADEGKDSDEEFTSGVDWPAESGEESGSTEPSSESSSTAASSSAASPKPEREREAVREEADSSSGSASSTAARLVVGILVILLLGGAGWYLLGQRGVVPSPRSTFAKLRAQLGRSVPQTIVSESPGRSPSTSGAASQPESAPDTSSQSEPASQTSPSAPEATPDSSPTEQSKRTDAPSSASPGINPALGGWSLVVASRSEQDPAEELASTYRKRFSETGFPVDVLVGQVENTTRYRVAVGQFDSRDAAQQAIQQHQNRLPQGVWPLRLQ